jgi:hypothetical protein
MESLARAEKIGRTRPNTRDLISNPSSCSCHRSFVRANRPQQDTSSLVNTFFVDKLRAHVLRFKLVLSTNPEHPAVVHLHGLPRMLNLVIPKPSDGGAFSRVIANLTKLHVLLRIHDTRTFIGKKGWLDSSFAASRYQSL